MSDAVSQYGFTPSRRGYAPDQVDAAVTALSRARDEAWERLSVLGGGLREMEKRLADIQQAAEEAPDPDFGELSDQAAALLGIALNEADAIHAKAERAGEDARDAAHETGEAAARAAEEYAAKLREETDRFVRRTDERSRAEAERIRAEADAEARALVHAATGHAARVRVAAANASEQSEATLAERRRKADEDFTAAEAAADAAVAKVTAAADARVKEAEQHREAMLAEARRLDTEAQAKADAALGAAREKAARIKAASEREQADFTKRLDKVQTHLDHIKGTLASLTGAAVGAIEDPEDAAEAVAAKKADLTKAPAADQPTTVLGPVKTAAKPRQDDPRKPYTPTVPAEIPAPPAKPASFAKDPVPPKPATAPEQPAAAPEQPATAPDQPATAPDQPGAAPEAAAERRIVPKIVIVDDGIDHDTRPDRNRIQRRG
ncbi:hypothetical protein K353_04780 [Kitasatospora sp. SolWspMP-SS2h]|uniref:hypothetical protein n=1 Tax=Kitasatospora sp. SolWspMP-SS2h TaxID=1305729 RepID=UPI000DBAC259|nr:hypothetical protein [Kitasatospora sp. SolWspMP-SS2h]RAJ36043.1 hypothetical protein K353_04780 [Kitasatospora sp. SolWspMP-SS2h]